MSLAHWFGFVSLLCLLAGAPLHAQTLRWAPRGDVLSMDPHAALETTTINVNALLHDGLVEIDAHDRIVPALATSWTVVEPMLWRFKLRRGVRFQDGTPFTADDVVFSIQRAQGPGSKFASFALPLGEVRRVDDETIELRQSAPNPTLLNQLSAVMMMSRAWCLAHGATEPANLLDKREAYSNRYAMGTGRYALAERQPGVRTVLVRNPAWWGRFEGNVQRVVLQPIASDATRTAALLSGDVDFTQDVPPQDADRLAKDPSLRLLQMPENRLIYLGLDQYRDELPRSSVKGRNPFKDVRVREAFARTIDAEALQKTIMRGQSQPTGCFSVSRDGCFAVAIESPPRPDLALARRLMAEAGFADGFALTLECPNDRYVNDQALCVALGGMLARIGVRIEVDASSKTVYFPKLEKFEPGFYLHGLGYSPDDPQVLFDWVAHSRGGPSRKGELNFARFADAEVDRLADEAGTEMDEERRKTLLRAAQQRMNAVHGYLPLHRQVLLWAARAKVHPVITADNRVRVDLIRVD